MRLKKRGQNDLKKVLIYGADGSGKSTFAEEYCREHNLNPVVIDIDDTNYTNLPILDLDFGNDIKTYNNIKAAISEIAKSEYDTIVLDGVTSLLEMLVSKANGLKKYSDRAERFQDILRAMMSSRKNLIFIGQADMEVIYNEEFQSNKMVIKINSIVNEKYLTYKKKEGYSHKVLKFRTVEQEQSSEYSEPETSISYEEPTFTTADDIEPVELDPISLNYCRTIKARLEQENKPVNKATMRRCLVKMIKANEIDKSLRPTLIKFINQHCPEGLE